MEVTNLKAYLAQIGMTMKQFGDAINYNHVYLRQVANGRVLPSYRLSIDIFRATNGVIKLQPNPKKSKKQKEEQKEENPPG